MCLCRGTCRCRETQLQEWGHHLHRDTPQGDGIAGDTPLQRDTLGWGGTHSVPQGCSMGLRWKWGSLALESPQLVRNAEKEKQNQHLSCQQWVVYGASARLWPGSPSTQDGCPHSPQPAPGGQDRAPLTVSCILGIILLFSPPPPPRGRTQTSPFMARRVGQVGGRGDAWVPGVGQGSLVGDGDHSHPGGSQQQWCVESWGMPQNCPWVPTMMPCATGTPSQGGGLGHPQAT